MASSELDSKTVVLRSVRASQHSVDTWVGNLKVLLGTGVGSSCGCAGRLLVDWFGNALWLQHPVPR